MRAEQFVERIRAMGITTLAGVPDSTLKPFCDYINREGKTFFHHYVPANEGAAVGMAIGSYLATGKAACVYMQNSGIGNAVNPITSLANGKVYGIPMLMIIGWRGEPGSKDEPQHKFMGDITGQILDVLEIPYAIIGKETAQDELDAMFVKARDRISGNRQFAFVVKRDFFDQVDLGEYCNGYSLVREDAVKEIISMVGVEDVLVSTTGKISREVYEQSDAIKGQHAQDFLTVGGMGHASMIALGIAKEMPHKKVYCLDGDGAVFMHMGSLAFIARQNPGNLIHICLNNEAHESVGGMPTGSAGLEYAEVAKACGYPQSHTVWDLRQLREVLERVRQENVLSFIEVKTAIRSRSDLGRPKEEAVENKNHFMKYHGIPVE